MYNIPKPQGEYEDEDQVKEPEGKEIPHKEFDAEREAKYWRNRFLNLKGQGKYYETDYETESKYEPEEEGQVKDVTQYDIGETQGKYHKDEDYDAEREEYLRNRFLKNQGKYYKDQYNDQLGGSRRVRFFNMFKKLTRRFKSKKSRGKRRMNKSKKCSKKKSKRRR